MVRICIAVVLAIVCVDGFAQKNKSSNKTLFSIKGEPVASDEFIYVYKKNHPAKEDFAKQKIEEYLNLYINFKLKVREARQRGIDTTASFLKEYNAYKEELKKPYLPEGKIIDSLVKITYSRLQEEVRVSHVLIMTKPEAEPSDTLQAYNKALEIKNRAQAGEEFGSLAALYSEEPNANTSKGDLGYFTALQMVYPFENAAYASEKGDIVGPVHTRFGYHVLKIEDRKPTRGEVEVAHIMIRTTPGQDEKKPKDLIFEIHDQLSGGVAWNDLCKQYSEDPNSKNSGGKLRPFGVGAMASVPAFDRVAFSLRNPGDISDPIQTQYGWHIIKLEKKIPLPSFEEMATSLKSRVARDERVQTSRQALMQKLKKDFSCTEYNETKTKVFSLADSTLTKGKWKVPSGYSFGKEELVSFNSRSVNAQDFLVYVQKNQRATTQTPTKYIELLYNTFVEKVIGDMLEAQIIKTHPDFEMLLKEYYEGILLFDIMEKEVWKKANEDSAGQANYFEVNAKKYIAEERAASIIYTSGTVETIVMVKKFVEQGDTLGLQKLLNSKEVRKEEGLYQKEERPVFAKIEWKPGLYSVENNRLYYLVNVQKIVPPGQLTFSEARASVISDYQDNLEKEWLIQLRKKFPVKINEKEKQHVVEKLKP